MQSGAFWRQPRGKRATGWYRRFLPWSFFGKAAVTLSALLVVAAAAALIISSRAADRERSERASRAGAGWTHYSSGTGYSFTYPRSWAIAEDGSLISVEHPDRQSVVTFDTAPRGEPFVTSGRLLASLRRTYEVVTVGQVAESSEKGTGTLDLRGEITRRDGTEMVFVARILNREGRPPTVATGFAAQDSERAIKQIERIVASLEPAGGAGST